MSHEMDCSELPVVPAHVRPTVSAAVIRDGCLLMVRQARGRHRNRWNLPGGKVDPGETLLDAVVRETAEETGYDLHVHCVAGLYGYVNRSGQHRLRCVFWGHVRGDKPRYDHREILEVRWVPLHEAFAMHPAMLAKPRIMRQILDDLRRRVDDAATNGMLAAG